MTLVRCSDTLDHCDERRSFRELLPVLLYFQSPRPSPHTLPRVFHCILRLPAAPVHLHNPPHPAKGNVESSCFLVEIETAAPATWPKRSQTLYDTYLVLSLGLVVAIVEERGVKVGETTSQKTTEKRG